jgi:hypothetical protein
MMFDTKDLHLPLDRKILRERVISQLTRLLEADRNLVEALVDNRIPVSEGYKALDEFVYMDDGVTPPSAGLIGILNGLLDFRDDGRLAASYDDDMKLIGFVTVDTTKR